MKKLKINLVALLALLIGVTTMSFKLYTSAHSVQAGWYAVDENGDLDPAPLLLPPDGSDGCEIDFLIDICAVHWKQSTTRPDNLSQYNVQEPNPEYAGRDN